MTTGFSAGGRWRDTGQTTAIDSDEFDAHFHDHIAPHFAALEAERLTLKDQYTWRLAIAAAGAFCLFLITVIAHILLHHPDGSPMIDTQAMIFVPLIGGVALMVWAQGPRKRYVREYKETLLPAIASFFGHFSYDCDGGIRMNQLNESTLIPSYDKYHHEDLFAGNYHDVDVEFCEARLTERRGSGRNRRTVTVFAGLFVLLTMNKDFKGRTVVRHDAGKLGNLLRDTFTSDLEPVKLEDPAFEKRFEVYSTDQVEARYLLTPAFMSRLMNLSKMLGTDNLEAAFYGAQLMLKLPTQNAGSTPTITLSGLTMRLGGSTGLRLGGSSGLFEPGSIYTSVYKVGDLDRIVDQFKEILSIVDILKLYQRTGL